MPVKEKEKTVTEIEVAEEEDEEHNDEQDAPSGAVETYKVLKFQAVPKTVKARSAEDAVRKAEIKVPKGWVIQQSGHDVYVVPDDITGGA